MTQLHLHLRSLIQRRIAQINRIFFEFGGAVDRGDGPLEIEFIDGLTCLLTGQSDGQTLDISLEPWRDPFAPPLTEENEAWIQEHGKWGRHDVSQYAPYHYFIGKPLTSISVLERIADVPGGLVLTAGQRSLFFWVDDDEDEVDSQIPVGYSIAFDVGNESDKF